MNPTTGAFRFQAGELRRVDIGFGFIVRVTDDQGASDTETFTISIRDVNNPPFLARFLIEPSMPVTPFPSPLRQPIPISLKIDLRSASKPELRAERDRS